MAYKPSPQTLARAALAKSKMSVQRSGKEISVKQASKEDKPTVRANQLAAKSATAYGATRGLAVGGEHGGAGVAQKADKGRVWTPDEVAALNKQRGTEPVKLTPAQMRMAAIKAAAEKLVAQKQRASERQFDVPTLQQQHDDLRDVHDLLHRSIDEEVEQLDEIGDTQKGIERLKKYIASDRSKVKFSDVAAARKSENPEKAIEKLAKRQGYKAKAMRKIRNFGVKQTPYKPKELHQIVYPPGTIYHGDSVELNGPTINEVKSVNEQQAADWQIIQKMDKGSLVGGKKGVKTRLAYLKAVHAHQKKHGLDAAATRKKIEGINRTLVQLGEAAVTNNPGHGYHGQHPDDVADQKYSKMHARVRTLTGTNSTMAKHYLDSTHGRHLAGNEDDHEYIKRDFLKFAKKYNADQFKEEVEQVDEISIINGKRQDPKSLVWKQTSMSYSVAVSKYGKENVKIEGKNRLGQPVVHVKVPLVGEETEQVDELKKSTLASYVKKAAFHGALNSAHHAYAASAGDIKNQEYHGRKSIKRQKGIATAADKLAREEVEQVDEMQQGKEYTQKQLQDKINSGNWETSYDIKPGKNVEMRHRSGKKVTVMVKNVQEEVEQVVEQDDTMEKVEMAQTQLHFICYAANEILEFVKMGGEVEEWYQNKLSKVHSDMESLHSYIEGEKRRTGMVKEEEEQIDEKAPPGAKYERMVKHIKTKYAKDGLTGKEKSIAYATAWKAYGKKNEETVTEAEGTVAVTPKEKALAAHHGDPKKITYGDVIKARLKSAAAKKMGK